MGNFETMGSANKIVGILSIGSFAGLLIFGLLSFFITPHYKEAVELALGVFKDGFLFAVGAKTGLSLPKSEEDAPKPPANTNPSTS